MQQDRYRVFVRTMYRREAGKIVPGWGRKTTIERNLTYDEARRRCQDYNATHNPGKLLRRAEFTKE